MTQLLKDGKSHYDKIMHYTTTKQRQLKKKKHEEKLDNTNREASWYLISIVMEKLNKVLYVHICQRERIMDIEIYGTICRIGFS